MVFPHSRLRRLRNSSVVRKILSENFPAPEKFILPLFVVEQKNAKIAIPSMPGQFRLGMEKLLECVENAVRDRIGGIMLFGVPEEAGKSVDGKDAWRSNGIVQTAIKEIKKRFKEDISVWSDVCLCSYTTSGHCGILTEDGKIDNDRTLPLLAKIAISHAEAGADGVAPSAMMDGQVCEIRRALDESGFKDTLIMSYSTKFASAFYGPFRDAANSAPKSGDRKSYQLPPADIKQALRESLEDEKEGADILMVKPALPYLDVISELRRRTLLPIAAYNVSGEYSMIHACAEKGWGDLYQMARESIASISRAGADIIISYWANDYKKLATDYN